MSGPITSVEKLINSDCTAIVWVVDGVAVGYAKYGLKDLFFYTKQGKVVERPRSLCLLDFFVSESMQRNGIGKLMFDKILGVRFDRIYVLSLVHFLILLLPY